MPGSDDEPEEDAEGEYAEALDSECSEPERREGESSH